MNLKEQILEDAGVIKEGWLRRHTAALLLGTSMAAGGLSGYVASQKDQQAIESNYQAEKYDQAKVWHMLSAAMYLCGVASGGFGVGQVLGNKEAYKKGKKAGYQEGYDDGHRDGFYEGKKWNIKTENVFIQGLEKAAEVKDQNTAGKILSDVKDGMGKFMEQASVQSAKISTQGKKQIKIVVNNLKKKFPGLFVKSKGKNKQE